MQQIAEEWKYIYQSFGDEELYVNVTSVNVKLPELVQSKWCIVLVVWHDLLSSSSSFFFFLIFNFYIYIEFEIADE